MNNNFQPLSAQQCKEINGGETIGFGGIIVVTGLTSLAVTVGNTLVAASTAVAGLTVELARSIGNLLGNIRLS